MTTTRTIVRSRRRASAAEVSGLLPPVARIIVLALITAIVVIPGGYVVLGSVNSDLGVARGDYWPSEFTLRNYVDAWSTVSLGTGILNSLIVAGSVAIVSAFLGLCMAYVIVRFPFPGRATILRALVGLQSVPGTLLLLPLFVVFASLGSAISIQIIGTREALFVTYLTFGLPFSTWIMVTYLRGLPVALEEAARLDGASNLGVLLRIILPLSWPGLVVAAIFAFLLGWNDVLFAAVLTTPDTRTAAVALQVFGAAQDGGALPLYGQMMAASVICAAPVVALYLAFQRYLVSGLTSGGVK